MQKLLELFAGSRSMSKEAEKMGMNTYSVDWYPYPEIDLGIDIELLETKDIPFIPDVIFSSPDCTTYSISAGNTHRIRGIHPKTLYAKKCDNVNLHFIELLEQWLTINPEMIFFIENPRGMLRSMPFMKKFNRFTIWYCQYNDLRAKPTDIWTNSTNWIPRPECKNGNYNCNHMKSPRSNRGGTQYLKDHKERSIIPPELCIEILKSCMQ